MNPNTAAAIVEAETPGLPIHKKMDAINQLMEINGARVTELPFATVDIRFAEFINFLNMDCTERERDLVIISENLCRVWKTLHLSVQTMKEKLTPQDNKEIRLLAPALKRLNLEHLITKGLNKKTLKVYQDVLKKD